MNIEKIKKLLNKYYDGETSREEEQELRQFFRSEDVPNKLKPHAGQFRYFEEQAGQSPDIDPFAKIDFDEKDEVKVSPGEAAGEKAESAFVWTLRIAAGFVFLLIGFSAGLVLDGENNTSDHQVAALRNEIQQIKEVLVYSGTYHRASAGERLSAVNISTQIPAGGELDRQITEILVHTMNNDKSVNVRMAAAEALFKFRDEPSIKKALVNSLAEQEDPLMQITLINMLVQLKAKGAINEMNKLLMNEDTHKLVRKRLEAGIAALQT